MGAKEIGFIGVGTMGKPMVRNLMKAGFELHIYARHPNEVTDVVKEGAVLHDSIAECVKGRSHVITIVGFPSDVESIYLSDGGILDSADAGTYLIDMTTSSPDLAKKLAVEGVKKGFHVLDAPVTGGESGAENGTLSILVGSSEADFEACMPVFEAMGTSIHRFGSSGKGQNAKLGNQIIIAGTLAGVCEALAYAKAEGLDVNEFLSAVSTGAAASTQLSTFGPMIAKGDFSPSFFLKHIVKDLRLAEAGAKAEGLNLEVLQQVLADYEQLEAEGYGNEGTQALFCHYEK